MSTIFSSTYLCKLYRNFNFILAASGTDITGVSTNARFSSYVEDDKEALVF